MSVCTAELCQCQGDEGEGSADALLENLWERKLSFTVEETGCLGACGMGTMVAIEYEDGTADLVAGLEETLDVLGIVDSKHETSSVCGTIVNEHTVASTTERPRVSEPAKAVSIAPPPATPAATANQPDAVVVTKKMSNPQSTPPVSDARDRMREAAKEADDVSNPWVNMAGYLTKKAGDALFGESS